MASQEIVAMGIEAQPLMAYPAYSDKTGQDAFK